MLLIGVMVQEVGGDALVMDLPRQLEDQDGVTSHHHLCHSNQEQEVVILVSLRQESDQLSLHSHNL